MSKKADHVHKYLKVKWGSKGTEVFRCMVPGCSHYVHIEMARNRMCICWGCGEAFVLDPDAMRRKRPKCFQCIKGVDPVMSKLDKLLEGL